MINYVIYEEDPSGCWEDEIKEEGDALSIEGAIELFRRFLQGIEGTVRRTIVCNDHPLKEGRYVAIVGDRWINSRYKKDRRTAVQYKLVYWEEG